MQAATRHGTAPIEPGTEFRRADFASAIVLGGLYMALAIGLAIGTGHVSARQLIAAALLVCVYSIGFRAEFVRPVGITVATEPVLVGMIFLLPLTTVPLAVACGLFLSGVDFGGGARHRARSIAVRACSGWHCVAPVAIIAAAGAHHPALGRWGVYLGALFGQFVVDGVVAAARIRSAGGRVGELAKPLLWTYGIDAMLAPLGLSAVIATRGSLVTVLFVALPVGVVLLLAQDRRQLAASHHHLGSQVETAREEARLDPLTGLGNRRAWYEAVEDGQRRISLDDQLAAIVIAADINHLKYANDTFGHDVGDQLIKEMAAVLVSVAPEHATVTRLGGDEFAMLVIGARRQLRIEPLVDALRAGVAAVGSVEGVVLSTAVGAARCPPEATIVEAYGTADNAVYSDKRARRTGRSSDVPLPFDT